MFSIAVGYESDIDRATEVIRATGAELARDHRYSRNLLSGLDILGLDRFDPNGIVVLAQFKTRPLMQAEITRGFNMRLKAISTKPASAWPRHRLTVRVDNGGISLDGAGGKPARRPPRRASNSSRGPPGNRLNGGRLCCMVPRCHKVVAFVQCRAGTFARNALNIRGARITITRARATSAGTAPANSLPRRDGPMQGLCGIIVATAGQPPAGSIQT